MPTCEEKGYEVGQYFKKTGNDNEEFSQGSILVLVEDDGSICPLFGLVEGEKTEHLDYSNGYELLRYLTPIDPPEES